MPVNTDNILNFTKCNVAQSAILIYYLLVDSELVVDRHQTLRNENNNAIKLAALALNEEKGLGQFTVEELAGRAEVSRRTFFNHFGSIHEATRAGLRDLLFEASESVVEALKEKAAGGQISNLAELFELCSQTMLASDFTPIIKRMNCVLGEAHSTVSHEWFAEVFATITYEIRELVSEAAPQIDALSRNLMIESLLASARITAEIWLKDSQTLNQKQAAELWHALQNQAFTQLRNGFIN